MTTKHQTGSDIEILIVQDNNVLNSSSTSSENTDPFLNSTEDTHPEKLDQPTAKTNNTSPVIDNSDDTILLACSNVITENNDNLVVAAMKSQDSDGIFTGFKEALITRNLFALSHVHVGPMPDEIQTDVVLSTTGDVVINGTLHAKHIADGELYLEGNNLNKPAVYNLLPGDGYNIVYINSIESPVHIMLGTVINNKFERNRRILFKDISLQYHNLGAMYNINIIVPYRPDMINAPRIEYYKGTRLTVGVNAGYAINSAGGSVTLRYYINSDNIGTWVIESQFIGNARSLSSNMVRLTK